MIATSSLFYVFCSSFIFLCGTEREKNGIPKRGRGEGRKGERRNFQGLTASFLLSIQSRGEGKKKECAFAKSDSFIWEIEMAVVDEEE